MPVSIWKVFHLGGFFLLKIPFKITHLQFSLCLCSSVPPEVNHLSSLPFNYLWCFYSRAQLELLPSNLNQGVQPLRFVNE